MSSGGSEARPKSVTENPWVEEANDLVGDETLHLSDLKTLKRLVARALARAYEYGHAQGRLEEVEGARARREKRIAVRHK